MTGTGKATLRAEVVLDADLTSGLAVTLTLDVAAALGFAFLPKRKLKAARGSKFVTAVCLVDSGYFKGAKGAAAGFFACGVFFVAWGVGTAGLAMAVGTALIVGLPPVRELKASS